MGERLIRDLRAKPNKLMKIGRLLSSGGLNLLESKATQEEIQAIESEGFVVGSIQKYINRLDTDGQAESAAMLRGAFNDLLDRLDDPQPTDQPAEIEPAA